ncbi:MAG: PadR family transcriptional regulator [Dehalococcoidia bacterium]
MQRDELLKYPLLAFLATGPAHGYELKQSYEARFSPFRPAVNVGQVYTTLQRLERDGFVRRHGVVETGEAPARHLYEITEDGRGALEVWLREPVAGVRLREDFFMKLVLARAAGLAAPAELLEGQRTAALQELHDLNELLLAPRLQDLTTQLLIEGAVLHLQADLRWMDLCEERMTQEEVP